MLSNEKYVGCRQVRELVGSEVAPNEPLAAQGLDSLAGMELRQKLQVPCSAIAAAADADAAVCCQHALILALPRHSVATLR
jgi:aryl carrier-like protein